MTERGRPTKLNYELIDQIAELIREGNYIETASAVVGIDKNSLYRWLKRGAREQERLFKNPKLKGKVEEKIYVEFSYAVKEAMAQSEADDLANIKKASREDWKASAWRLERRFPNRWGRKEKVDIDANMKNENVNREEVYIEQKITTDQESADLLKQLYRRQRALD
jgi:hypothetical protein